MQVKGSLRNSILLPMMMYGLDIEHSNQECVLWKLNMSDKEGE